MKSPTLLFLLGLTALTGCQSPLGQRAASSISRPKPSPVVQHVAYSDPATVPPDELPRQDAKLNRSSACGSPPEELPLVAHAQPLAGSAPSLTRAESGPDCARQAEAGESRGPWAVQRIPSIPGCKFRSRRIRACIWNHWHHRTMSR
jgi:hypothetical protein